MPGDLNAVQMVALTVMTALAVAGVLLLPRIWGGQLASTYEHASVQPSPVGRAATHTRGQPGAVYEWRGGVGDCPGPTHRDVA